MKKSTPAPVVAHVIRAAQFKDLQRRTQTALQEALYGRNAPPDPKEPADVAKARRLVRKYDEAQTRRKNRRVDAMRARAAKVRNLTLYGDVQKALRAVEAFESLAKSV